MSIDSLPTRADTSGDMPPEPERIVIRPLAYLRSVLALAWGAFRYPGRTTYVDLLTGAAVHIRPGEESWE